MEESPQYDNPTFDQTESDMVNKVSPDQMAYHSNGFLDDQIEVANNDYLDNQVEMANHSNGYHDNQVTTPVQNDLVEVKGDPFRKYKIGKQAVLVLVWICLGLAAEIVGPTLPDLKDRLDVNYEEVSQALLGKGIGSMFGAVIGGFINEKFYQYMDLFLAVCLMLISVATVVIPFSKVLALTATMFALNGMAEGIINTGGNTMVMHLFGEDTASPMHSLHFGFGLGALLAPQVARSFLSPDALEDDDEVTTMSYTTPSGYNGTVAPWEDLSRMEIPYCIIGGAIFAFSLVLIGFFLKGPPKGFQMHQPSTKVKDMISPGSCAGGNVIFGVEVLICLFFYYFQAVGGERAYGKFLFSFAIESDMMKKSEASNLQTAFWASFTAGRGLGVVIAKFVPLRYVMIGNIVGNILVSVILAIFAHQEVLVLWVFSCFLGMLIAVVFPNGMSWANLHLQMNSMAVMILIIGASCGDFAYNYLTGYLFEKDPKNLMYVMVGYAIILVVCYVILEVLARIHGRNMVLQKAKEENEKEENDIAVVFTKGEIYSSKTNLT